MCLIEILETISKAIPLKRCQMCIFICKKGDLSVFSPYSSITNLTGVYPCFRLTLYIEDKSVVTMSTVPQLWLYETAVILYRCVKSNQKEFCYKIFRNTY